MNDSVSSPNTSSARHEEDMQEGFPQVPNQVAPEKKLLIENTKVTRFYEALLDFVINQEGSVLGNYFLDEHDEMMIKVLTICRYSRSVNETVNRLFECLMNNGHTKLCALLYFFYTVVG